MTRPYNVSIEPLTEINQRAHRGGGTETIEVDSGEGLVEDQYEAHLKNLYVAYREPAALKMAQLASRLEKSGFGKAACKIDVLLDEFYNPNLVKQALAPAGWAAGLAALWNPATGFVALQTGIGAAIYKAVVGVVEGLVEDTKDLQDNIEGWMNDEDVQPTQPYPQQLYAKAQSLAEVAASLDTKTKGLQADPDAQTLSGFGQELDQAEQIVNSIQTDLNHIVGIVGKGLFNQDFVRTQSLVQALRTDLGKERSKLYDLQRQSKMPATQQAQPAPQQGAPLAKTEKDLAEMTQLEQWQSEVQGINSELTGLQTTIDGLIRAAPENEAIIRQMLTPEFKAAYKRFKTQTYPDIMASKYNPDRFPQHGQFLHNVVDPDLEQFEQLRQKLNNLMTPQ